MFGRQRWGVRRFFATSPGQQGNVGVERRPAAHGTHRQENIWQEKNLAVCLRTPMSEYQLSIIDWRLDPNNSATVG